VTIDQAAIEAGATVLGDPPHYLLTAEQLEILVELLAAEVPPPPY
jgi:hypothetical protein